MTRQVKIRGCNCAGTAPGYPQHESFCGWEQLDCADWCKLGDEHDGDCLDAQDIAEERLRARDYEAWSRL